MGIWEKIYNHNFNVTEFSNIRNESGGNGYVLTSKQWIEKTNAIGIIAKQGVMGTYAHRDIAFEFAMYVLGTAIKCSSGVTVKCPAFRPTTVFYKIVRLFEF